MDTTCALDALMYFTTAAKPPLSGLFKPDPNNPSMTRCLSVKVDNYGFGCRVDLETGKICSPGVSGDGSLGITYDEHPMTHVKLLGRQVPLFFEACEMVKKAALKVPQMRYIGWDVGISPESPVIIEGNNYTAHDFWQLPAQTPEKQGMLPTIMKLVPEFKR